MRLPRQTPRCRATRSPSALEPSPLHNVTILPSPPAVLGVVLAIGGSVLIVSYAPSSDKQLTMEVLEEYMSDASFIVFVSCLVIATV